VDKPQKNKTAADAIGCQATTSTVVLQTCREVLHSTRAFCTSSGCLYSITPASAYCLAGLAVVACIPVMSSISSIMLAPGGDTVPVFSTARRIDPCSHQAHGYTAAVIYIGRAARNQAFLCIGLGTVTVGSLVLNGLQTGCMAADVMQYVMLTACTCCRWRWTRVCGCGSQWSPSAGLRSCRVGTARSDLPIKKRTSPVWSAAA
jgi:hypothetical protein